MSNVTTIDFETLGFASGATAAKRDRAHYAHLNPQVGQAVNAPDPILLTAMAATLAPEVVETLYAALQPDRLIAKRDEQFEMDCQAFAGGFEQGYWAALK